MPLPRHFAAVLALVISPLGYAQSASPVINRPTLANLNFPGDVRYVAAARDVLLVQSDFTPDFASQSGLIDDGLHLPSFAPAHIAALTGRLHRDMATLKSLPWRSYDVDQQIDVRWVYANAARMEHQLTVEKLYLHRPGAWLETTANDYIAILTYAPERHDALAAITAQIPAMVREMRRICQPTSTDADISVGLIDGINVMLKTDPSPAAENAIAVLTSYRQYLKDSHFARPFVVIGKSNYAWDLKHASLLPWTPDSLRTLAEQQLAQVDAEIAPLKAQLPAKQPLSAALEQQAKDLDQASLLRDYDEIQIQNRRAIEQAGFVTVPDSVGPIHARVTPDAMVPLTGDGGSMNPPPPFIDSNIGWWNVEHFDPAMSLEDRENLIRVAVLFRENGFGSYAAHEGLPGHHLQLSIARLNPDPVRSLLQDAVQNEGWALYAEDEMWQNGGLGDSVRAHVGTLRSWRFRIRRVIYDVNVETGQWTLQEAADWKDDAARGQGKIDPDLLRSINWPTQLICYFAGREQILALKADFKRKLGADYTERRFNDELLALGSVPYVFARAKMLGEPVPDF